MTFHHTDRAARRHSALRLGYVPAALLLLGLCSCSNIRNQMVGDPFGSDSEALAINAFEESADGTTKGVEPAVHVEDNKQPALKARQKPAGGDIIQLSGQEMDGGYCPPGFYGGGADDGYSPGHALFAPAMPGVVVEENDASPVKYPDEYIYDGGDRATSVHYTGYGLGGFDPEDAVAEYRDDTGARHIKESNRVAVYSPRFAAVSVISTLGEETDVDRAAASKVSEYGVNYYTRTALIEQQENLGSERVRTRVRASGLERDEVSSAVDTPTALAENSKLINTFQDYRFILAGELIQNEAAVIQKGMQAAAVWSHHAYPVLVAKTAGPNEVYTRWTAEEVAGTDKRDKTKGRIRLVKLADKHIAEKGEIVTFTIRYDNVGDLPVSDVVIMDNLTVRLSYIEGTETSDRAGEFETEDNGSGSLILRWKLEKPLAGGEGGVVTFQSRVE